MPFIETKNIGTVSYEPESELEFPCGLPGFEHRKLFIAATFAHSEPLIYLQSLDDPDLCFITMPILAVDPAYRLTMSGDDLELLELPRMCQPVIGGDVVCVAVISVQESGPTANLLAPIVINLRNRKAVQAVAPESGYSHQFELMPQEAAVC